MAAAAFACSSDACQGTAASVTVAQHVIDTMATEVMWLMELENSRHMAGWPSGKDVGTPRTRRRLMTTANSISGYRPVRSHELRQENRFCPVCRRCLLVLRGGGGTIFRGNKAGSSFPCSGRLTGQAPGQILLAPFFTVSPISRMRAFGAGKVFRTIFRDAAERSWGFTQRLIRPLAGVTLGDPAKSFSGFISHSDCLSSLVGAPRPADGSEPRSDGVSAKHAAI